MPVYQPSGLHNVYNMVGDVTAVQDNVDSPDANNLLVDNTYDSVYCTTLIPKPANNLVGMQTVRFNSADTLGIGVQVYVRQNQSDVHYAGMFYTDGVNSFQFDVSVLNDPSGAELGIQFYGEFDQMNFGVWEGLRAVELITNEQSATTTPPVVTIASVTRNTISDETGYDSTDIVFSFDQDVQTAKVMLGGISESTGVLIEEFASGATMGQELTVNVDWTELGGEGDNRINIYGQNSNGEWTPYEG